MSTYMAKAETIERKWYVIDAAGKPVGKTAVAAANILRGKHRPEFTPHADCGEFVIIINAEKAIFTGKKLTQKITEKPEKVLEMAVKGMLPKNTIGAKSFTRLRVYAGAEHGQQAQKPIAYEG